ncbi:Multidrug resistance protein MdtK [Arsenophonus endosymbiont of Bemisia tabaci Q2]|nr:Multidrug resistance protein MdtK [Arsenophonus endosymbiont of Bemisia tabaci Q2]
MGYLKKPGMFIGFLGLFINIPINYIFIYGHLGAPALGGLGCGIATASVISGYVSFDALVYTPYSFTT